MRHSFAFLLAFCLLVAPGAYAGNLTFDNGQTIWHSTQCTKPVAPESFLKAHPETAGDEMNNLAARHNAYVDQAQKYMNCISSESESDQNMVNKAIADGAKQAISEVQAEIDSDTAAMRNTKR